MILHANLREAGTDNRDAPEPEHRYVQVETDTYEAGRHQITADLPKGWIVASWRVER